MVTWLVPHLSKLAVRVRFGVPGDSVAVLRALLQKLAKLFSLSTATYAPRDEAPLDGRTISADGKFCSPANTCVCGTGRATMRGRRAACQHCVLTPARVRGRKRGRGIGAPAMKQSGRPCMRKHVTDCFHRRTHVAVFPSLSQFATGGFASSRSARDRSSTLYLLVPPPSPKHHMIRTPAAGPPAHAWQRLMRAGSGRRAPASGWGRTPPPVPCPFEHALCSACCGRGDAHGCGWGGSHPASLARAAPAV